MKLTLFLLFPLLAQGSVYAQNGKPTTKPRLEVALLGGSNSALDISANDESIFFSQRAAVFEFQAMLSKPVTTNFSILTGASFGHSNIRLNSNFDVDIISPEVDRAPVQVDFQGINNIYIGVPLLISYQHQLGAKLHAVIRAGLRGNVRLGSGDRNDQMIPYLRDNASPGNSSLLELGTITWNRNDSRYGLAYVLSAAFYNKLRNGHFISLGLDMLRSPSALSKGKYSVTNVREPREGSLAFRLNYFAFRAAYSI